MKLLLILTIFIVILSGCNTDENLCEKSTKRMSKLGFTSNYTEEQEIRNCKKLFKEYPEGRAKLRKILKCSNAKNKKNFVTCINKVTKQHKSLEEIENGFKHNNY